MFNFREYLQEQAEEPQGKKLQHLTHLEDHALGGHTNIGVAAQHLEDVHNALLGKKTSTHISTKYDGAPSILFGTHPDTGKFFVATKGAFAKTPKINYSFHP